MGLHASSRELRARLMSTTGTAPCSIPPSVRAQSAEPSREMPSGLYVILDCQCVPTSRLSNWSTYEILRTCRQTVGSKRKYIYNATWSFVITFQAYPRSGSCPDLVLMSRDSGSCTLHTHFSSTTITICIHIATSPSPNSRTSSPTILFFTRYNRLAIIGLPRLYRR